MSRDVVMIELRAGWDRTEVAAIEDGFRALEPPGCLSDTVPFELTD
jgi:hypothetical protein